MADIIGAIFGTSSTTTQQTVPDPVAQALNMVRLNQAVNMFSGDRPLYQFADPNTQISTPTDATTDLINIARSEAISPRTNLDFIPSLDFNQYLQAFQPVTDAYNAARVSAEQQSEAAQQQNVADFWGLRNLSDEQRDTALGRSYGDYATGTQATGTAYSTALGNLEASYNNAIARGDYDLARSIAQSRSDYTRSASVAGSMQQRAEAANAANLLQSLGVQEAARARALGTGEGAISDYITRIATPRLKQELALQGLESGGAVPTAIARASAEQAVPFLQAIEQLYGTNVAQQLAQYMSVQGTLGQQGLTTQAGIAQQLAQQSGEATQQAAVADAALGQQRLAATSTAGNTYQQSITQLAQALMANNITLEQAGISANSALGQQLLQAQSAIRAQTQQAGVSLAQTYTPLAASYAQSLPQASATLGLQPLAQQSARIANLNAMAPLADIPRNLAESDYLRRQGLFTSVYTGIPFSPGSTSHQASGTGNIFDQLGGTISSGVTGGSGGFSTLGTKT